MYQQYKTNFLAFYEDIYNKNADLSGLSRLDEDEDDKDSNALPREILNFIYKKPLFHLLMFLSVCKEILWARANSRLKNSLIFILKLPVAALVSALGIPALVVFTLLAPLIYPTLALYKYWLIRKESNRLLRRQNSTVDEKFRENRAKLPAPSFVAPAPIFDIKNPSAIQSWVRSASDDQIRSLTAPYLAPALMHLASWSVHQFCLLTEPQLRAGCPRSSSLNVNNLIAIREIMLAHQSQDFATLNQNLRAEGLLTLHEKGLSEESSVAEVQNVTRKLMHLAEVKSLSPARLQQLSPAQIKAYDAVLGDHWPIRILMQFTDDQIRRGFPAEKQASIQLVREQSQDEFTFKDRAREKERRAPANEGLLTAHSSYLKDFIGHSRYRGLMSAKIQSSIFKHENIQEYTESEISGLTPDQLSLFLLRANHGFLDWPIRQLHYLREEQIEQCGSQKVLDTSRDQLNRQEFLSALASEQLVKVPTLAHSYADIIRLAREIDFSTVSEGEVGQSLEIRGQRILGPKGIELNEDMTLGQLLEFIQTPPIKLSAKL